MKTMLLLQTENVTNEQLSDLVYYLGQIKDIDCPICLHDVKCRKESAKWNLVYLTDQNHLDLWKNSEISNLMDEGRKLTTVKHYQDFFTEMYSGEFKYY